MRWRELWALARAVRRELLWGLPSVCTEIGAWRLRARTIPDGALRNDALDAIARKRAHADGAALFATLPGARHLGLLRLLVAYQTAWDFLDNASERGRGMGERNGRQLHRALAEALDPTAQTSDYYRHHLSRDDGGYLQALACDCRERCAALPAYERVRARVLPEARRCAIQSLNHNPDPAARTRALRRWAQQEQASVPGREDEREDVSWFEVTAAASASLVPHVLLALAAEPACASCDVAAAHNAYLPWASLATAMLDSYADRAEDERAGEHSYIAHYGDGEVAERRLAEIVARATHEAHRLRAGQRHAVILACMVAMYLSKDSLRRPYTSEALPELARAGGGLTRLLLPVLRAWRIAYGQRAS